jgi:hypothetical protein
LEKACSDRLTDHFARQGEKYFAFVRFDGDF